jgi:CDGSH iron-sulfur domain-containing protein 3
MKPKIAEMAPYVMKLERGTYLWCACGYAQTQPFCDGSHYQKAPEFKGLFFQIEKAGNVALCVCKHTENQPFCDGSHNRL